LGAPGRRFESCRPDSIKTKSYLRVTQTHFFIGKICPQPKRTKSGQIADKKLLKGIIKEGNLRKFLTCLLLKTKISLKYSCFP